MSNSYGDIYNPTNKPSAGTYVFITIVLLILLCGGGSTIIYYGAIGHISLVWIIAGGCLVAAGLACSWMMLTDYKGNSAAWDKLERAKNAL